MADRTWHKRRDRGQLLPSETRPDGTLVASGYAARLGILEYLLPDGSIRRELVTPEALRSGAEHLGRAPLTLEHPAEDVTPGTFQRDGVGDVDSQVEIDEYGYVQVKVAIRRQDAIDAVNGGKVELSCGYAALVLETPGEHPDFGRYDAVQVDRKTNHLAVVALARAGHSVRLNTDAGEATTTIVRRTNADIGAKPMQPGMYALLAAFGITHQVSTDAAAIELILAKKRKDEDEEVAAEAEAEEEVDKMKAAMDKLQASFDAMKAEYDAMKGDKAAADEKADRADLEPIAASLRVDSARHPKARDLRRAIAEASLGKELRKDASDAYVDGLVDAARERHGARDHVRSDGERAWDASELEGARYADGSERKVRRGPSAASAARWDSSRKTDQERR